MNDRRLTRWNGNRHLLPQGVGAWREIADRLGAYEDTGLEPEEVQALTVQFDLKLDSRFLDELTPEQLTALNSTLDILIKQIVNQGVCPFITYDSLCELSRQAVHRIIAEEDK